MSSFFNRLRALLPPPRPPFIPRYKPPKAKPLPTPRLHGLDVGDQDLPKTEDENPTVERLPVEKVKPTQEYPQLVYRWRNFKHVRERGKRKTAFVWGMLKREPGAVMILGGTMGGVWLICLWEAFLNVKVGVSGVEVWRYAIRFANANTFCALTNTSVAPETIAASLNLSPHLFEFVPVSAPPGEMFADPQVAENRLSAIYARAARGMAAGYIAVASLLRLLNLTMLAGSVFRERTLNGRESPFLGVKGRVFRLCGRVSDTLTMSLTRDKEHLLPIIEDPSIVRHLMTTHTKNGTVPIAWTVRESEYGNPSAWEGLIIDDDALLTTNSGERLLYLEADTTMSEDALRLGTGAHDLSIEDACAAFRMLEDSAKLRADLPPFRSVRVVLGDVLQKNTTGAGNEYTLRQRVRFRHEVDILVDSKLPILTEIIQWADRAVKPGWWQDRKLVFETDSQEYYHNLSALLRTYGFVVLDISEVTSEEADRLPRLIYYRRTAGTVNALRATLDTTDSPPPLCCVIDTKEGLDTLTHLRTDPLPETTTVICSAAIYDDLLRTIRTWTRMGYTPRQIQRELDVRSSYVARIASTIAEAVQKLKEEGALKQEEQAEKDKLKDAVLATQEKGSADDEAIAAAKNEDKEEARAADAAAADSERDK
ncbi:hypothetical protein BDZ88DRAFT_66388 [Geranomyces variabilis]|nr:hypothetical protein BDZ88DRAFT_66388 [Geranomyces variabilis]KAJ3131233.1 hypothetical protein HDU90_008649 [Geranomyces variabilis]